LARLQGMLNYVAAAVPATSETPAPKKASKPPSYCPSS
jgi:hypothetical protein